MGSKDAAGRVEGDGALKDALDCGKSGGVDLITNWAMMAVDCGISRTGALFTGLVACKKALSTSSLARNSSAICRTIRVEITRGW